MSESPTIRPARLPDLFGLRLLYSEIVTHQALPYPRFDSVEDLTAFTVMVASRLDPADPRFICFVAETDDGLVGFVLGEVCERLVGHPRRFGLCHWLYVTPAHQGSGVGRALTVAAVMDGIAKGVEAVELSAKPGDDQWARRGWLPISTAYALPISAVESTIAPTTAVAGEPAHEEFPNGRERRV